jgi:hypothetical protein
VTDLVTANRSRTPDQVADAAATILLTEIRESVLRLVAELPSPPGSIRISARDIAVELEWPATDQQANPAVTADGQPESGEGSPPPPPIVRRSLARGRSSRSGTRFRLASSSPSWRR